MASARWTVSLERLRAGGYGHIALVALEGVPDSAAPGSTTGASP